MTVNQILVQPSLETVRKALSEASTKPSPPNLVPVSTVLSSEFHTPSELYLKLTKRYELFKASEYLSLIYMQISLELFVFIRKRCNHRDNWQIQFHRSRFDSLLLYLASTYGIVGPHKILASGRGYEGGEQDPLPRLDAEISQFRVAQIPGITLPPLIGGAIGYVGYDCVKYFEPRTRRDLKDVVQVPESLFMLFDTIIAVDHFFQQVKVFTYLKVPENLNKLDVAYQSAKKILEETVAAISVAEVPIPHQEPITSAQEYTSNIGQAGYEAHVTRLKEKISRGEIIQAVPSQRIARPSSLHPFNIYRRLRTVNPSPYLFFVDCKDFQIIGASPEVLVKSEGGRIITHPIAGTVRRGKTSQEDDELAEELRNSLKDRAEHVMLVSRNVPGGCLSRIPFFIPNLYPIFLLYYELTSSGGPSTKRCKPRV
jgi:anthranilate synthase component I